MLAVLLTGALGFAGGCGAAGSSTPASVPAPHAPIATPTAHDSGAYSPISAGLGTRSQYVGLASAINLRPGDVPGFIGRAKTAEPHISVHNKAFEAEGQYERCFRAGEEAKPVFKATSDKFKAGKGLNSQSVGSEVKIMRSVAAAEHEVATTRRALQDAAARSCLARMFDAFGTQGQATRLRGGTMRVTLGGLRLAPVDVESVTEGTDGGVGLSLSMNVTYHFLIRRRSLTVPTSLHIDALAFVVGRASITLSTLTLGAPFPSGLEARLFLLLASRGIAAGHEYPDIVQPGGSSKS
jgi:hypothetical protein